MDEDFRRAFFKIMLEMWRYTNRMKFSKKYLIGQQRPLSVLGSSNLFQASLCLLQNDVKS